jgi:hypothetical protein
MKGLAMILLTAALAAASLRCAAETDCDRISVPANVEAMREELTLADLLAPGTCGRLRRAAAQVGLGAAPGGGVVRVLDGDRIRGMLEGLVDGTSARKEHLRMQVPGRIAIRRAGRNKSCVDFARFVAAAVPAEVPKRASALRNQQPAIDCAAAPRIPQNTPLELTKTSWNTGLHRWEFAVRCSRSEDCVPFLLWMQKENTAAAELTSGQTALRQSSESPAPNLAPARSQPGGNNLKRLVQRGQTVTLTWDQSGIRMVLPVTCLDAGALGEFVWVRFKNAPGILRAEVMADGTLRVSL